MRPRPDHGAVADLVGVTGAVTGVLALLLSSVQEVRHRREEAARRRAPWRLERIGGEAWTLTNIGNDPAYRVEIDPGDVDTPNSDLNHVVLQPGQSVRLMLSPRLSTSRYQVIVTWSPKARSGNG
jgi:hypothetical protein